MALSKAVGQKIILFAVVILVVFALIQFVTRPSIRALNNLGKQISQARADLKKTEALIAKKPQMDSQLISLQTELEDLKSALPLYSEMPNILQDISRLAGESKVKILKVEPMRQERLTKTQPKQSEARSALPIYMGIPIKIEAKGGYHSLGRFINKIENSENFMSIADLNVESNPVDMYSHDIRLLIVAYVLQEELPSK